MQPRRADLGLVHRPFADLQQIEVLLHVRELQEDVCGPEAARPHPERALVQRDELIAGLRGDEGDEGGERGEGERGGDDVMREHVVGVLERVVREH